MKTHGIGSPRRMKRLYDIQEASCYLGRTEGAVRELIYKGILATVKIDRRVQIDVYDMDRLIDKSRVTEDTF